jgi:hypothetical protein
MPDLCASVCDCRRWQELGNVLTSPGLLEDSMQLAVQAAASQLPSNLRSSPAAHAAKPRTSSSSSSATSHGSSLGSRELAAAQQQAAQVQQPALKLDDIVVLGKSKPVRGKIR